jgi:hypothetical protein
VCSRHIETRAVNDDSASSRGSRGCKTCATDFAIDDAVIAFVRNDALMTSRRGALTLHDEPRPLVTTNEDSLTAAEEATHDYTRKESGTQDRREEGSP